MYPYVLFSVGVCVVFDVFGTIYIVFINADVT